MRRLVGGAAGEGTAPGRGRGGPRCGRERGERPHPVLRHVQDLAEVADLGGCVGEVVGEVEAVVLLGLLGLLTGCFEELAELRQQTVGGLKDLVQEGGGVRV